MKKLHLWVWGTAAVAGVVAAALNEYRPNHHLCYVCAEFAPRCVAPQPAGRRRPARPLLSAR